MTFGINSNIQRVPWMALERAETLAVIRHLGEVVLPRGSIDDKLSTCWN